MWRLDRSPEKARCDRAVTCADAPSGSAYSAKSCRRSYAHPPVAENALSNSHLSPAHAHPPLCLHHHRLAQNRYITTL